MSQINAIQSYRNLITVLFCYRFRLIRPKGSEVLLFWKFQKWKKRESVTENIKKAVNMENRVECVLYLSCFFVGLVESTRKVPQARG